MFHQLLTLLSWSNCQGEFCPVYFCPNICLPKTFFEAKFLILGIQNILGHKLVLDATASQEIPYIQVTLTYSLTHKAQIIF